MDPSISSTSTLPTINPKCLTANLKSSAAAEDLRLAVRHLGLIVGRVDVEEILGSIFNDFCIGK